MSYSITQANSDLQAVLHGTSLSKVQGINNLHNRTARQLLSDLDPIETERIALTTTPLFNQIWDYACPADLKGNRIIDISPPFQRNSGDVITQTYQQNFDLSKNLPLIASDFTIQYNNAVKTIRINDTSLPQGIVLDTCEATTGWAVGGTASNLTEDNLNYAVGSGSLSFNVTTGDGSITKTLSSSLDMSSQLNQSSLFYYLYLPNGSALASGSQTYLAWGSDSSNYYYSFAITTNEGNAFQTGWNLVRVDWASATVVGSPDPTSIDYVSVHVTTTSNQTGIKVDNIISDMGLYRNLKYYSKFLFRNSSTGAFQETVLDNSDLINLDTESYNIYFNLLAFYTTQQVQGLDAMFFDSNFFGQEYLKGKARYTALNKSEVSKPHDSYYALKQGGFGKFLGRRSY